MELDAGIALQIGGIVDEKVSPIHKGMPKPAPKPIRRRFGGSGVATAGQILNVATYPQPAARKMWVIRKLGIYGSDGHTQVSTPNNPTPSQPAVPASTVAVQNTNAYTVQVVISAGTITQVFVNGIQVGTSAGTYTVPPNGAISITYSVAPTWVWSYAPSNPNIVSLATADIFAGSTQDENTVDFTGIIASAVSIPFRLGNDVETYGNRHLTCYGLDQVYALVTGAPTGQTIVLVGEADEYMLDDVEATHIDAKVVAP